MVCLFRRFPINGPIQYGTFCVWPLPLSITSSRCSHMVPGISASLLFVAELYHTAQMDRIYWSIYPRWVFGLFSPFGCCEQCWCDYCLQVFVWMLIFNSFGYVLRSDGAGLCGTATFHLLRNSQTVFHSGCTTVHSTSNIAEFWYLYLLANLPQPPQNANTPYTFCICLCTMALWRTGSVSNGNVYRGSQTQKPAEIY